jgi:hypothetical protein
MQFGFPFTFLFGQDRWVPRNDVFLIDPRTRFNPQVWNVNCINCHATAGQPRQDPQTKVISSRVGELGIACESCHGPAEDHVRINQNPTRRYALHRGDGPDATIFNPGRADHVKSSEACGQCHAIRKPAHPEQWNREGPETRPGEPLDQHYPLVEYDPVAAGQPGRQSDRAILEGSFWRDGQVRVSGRDFHAMEGSACYKRGRLSCFSCHSMHHYQEAANQLGADMQGNQACRQCHSSIVSRPEQHTHHSGNSSGSLCYNCHMPHTTYGLMRAIRSHRIDSPRVKTSLETGRPNACNLCHLDRSLEWTSRHLGEWYGQPQLPLQEDQRSTSAALLWLLKGDAGQRALLAWHLGWEPARRVSGENWLAPYLAELLIDPYSTVRSIAHRSLGQLPGYGQFSYDYIASPEERAASRRAALEIWNGQAAPLPGGDRLLLQPDGRRQEQKVAALIRQRDDRSMELLE